jgi:ABC transporter, substrate-binding protein
MKKNILLAASILAVAAFSVACQSKSAETTAASQAEQNQDAQSSESADETKAASGDLRKIKVGASPSPHAEILEEANKVLKDKGYELDIVVYNDYVQPNIAVDTGELDANFFQHYPYLESFNEERGTKVVSAGVTHYEPFGIYAGKVSSLDDLKDGAKIAVPNDVTNEARALQLLAAQGLIKIKDGAGLTATKNDIVENPKNIELLEVEAAQVPRSLQDVDVAVVNGNYAIEAGLKVKDALAVEDASSEAANTYANIVAVKEGNEKNEEILALLDAIQSPEVKKFIEDKYEGAVVPLF